MIDEVFTWWSMYGKYSTYLQELGSLLNEETQDTSNNFQYLMSQSVNGVLVDETTSPLNSS